MPPQKGLLDGFATGLMCLHSHLEKTCPDTICDIVNFSTASEAGVEEGLRKHAKHLEGRQVLVGITTTTASYQNALVCARLAKRSIPGCHVVFGGPHAGADSENVLTRHRESVDYVVIGEGERPLEHLVSNASDPVHVPGLAYIDRHGRYSVNPSPPPLRQDELDRIDVLYRGGFAGSPGKFATTTYVSARGCPLKCAFCCVANQPIRARSIPQVKADVKKLVRAGHRRISIEDNFFAHAPARTRDICQAFRELQEEGFDFEWDCQTRVESLARRDTIQQLVNGGCVAVYVGVESLVPNKLTYLNKARRPDIYLKSLGDEVIPRVLDSPLDFYMNLQFGIPGESQAEFDESCERLQEWGQWASDLDKLISIFPQLHVVYPGTEHFRQGIAATRFPPDVFESFTEWEAMQEPVLNWLGEHFAHGTGGLPEGILDSEQLKHAEFRVEFSETSRISTWLHKMGSLPGISVFHYGAHLTHQLA
jgi:radical SAM superfamily enzyme YgiQ (UPF0313 family)